MVLTNSKNSVQIGDKINQYRILDRIGEGGMGAVYLAEDTRLQRKVALKFVTNALLDSADVIARFHREARAAARLNHPNICTVYELGEAEEKTFISMEYVEGVTLKERMVHGNIEKVNIRKWMGEIVLGLQTAHEAGIIHRDVKPANIMIDNRGLIKIMDFGIAKLAESETELTQENSTLGTIAYMSPEQARGEEIDERADIWSVGVILYELATGQRPFKGAFREAVMYAMMHEDPPVPSEINPSMPEDLEQIINKCLQRERVDRYGSMDEVLADLGIQLATKRLPATEKYSGGEVGELLTVSSQEGQTENTGTRLGSKKRRWIALGIGVLLGLLMVFPGLRKQLSGSNGDESGLPSAMHLAVLPFDTFSEESEDTAFSNGLAHLVATNLMRMEHDNEEMWIIPVREVISREVKSASEAKEAFNVNLTVSGTIIEVGEGTQISLDVTDVRTLRVIASELIELKELDAGSVQEEVMGKLAAMLDLQLSEGSEQLFASSQTTDPEAYKLYIQAQGFMQRYDDEGNIDEALRLYEEAISIDSTYALAYAGAGFGYARKYYYSKEIAFFEKAGTYVDRALELNDTLAEVWMAVGRVRLDTGELEEARTALEKAISIDPDSYEAHRRLGFLYEEAQEFEKAEEYYKKAVEILPNYWAGHTRLASFYSWLDRREEAIAALNQAVKLTPENSAIYTQLGIQYFNIEDTLKSIKSFEQSLRIKPNSEAYYFLAITLRIGHEYQGALEAFIKALEYTENSPSYSIDLGNTYFVLNQPDSARVYWLQALSMAEEHLEKVNPNDFSSLLIVSEVHAKLGNKDQAMQYLQRILDLEGQSGQYWNYVYQIYEYMEDREKALAALEEALKLDFEPWYHDWSPWLVDVYDDPNYRALLEKYDFSH